MTRRDRAVVLVAAAAFATAAAAYGGVLVWFSVNEDALLFRPEAGEVAAPPPELGLGIRDVTIARTAPRPVSPPPPAAVSGLPQGEPQGELTGELTGELLRGRLIPPPPEASPATAPWILYLHGASGNVGTLGYNHAWAQFRRMGLGVLAVDYRGYGESAGKPSEAGLYSDARAAYTYLTRQVGAPPERILIYGYSLGSAVAIDLATEVPAAGLLVEGAFTSVPRRGAELYPYLPVDWLARNRFASDEKIARVSMPKLFLHARGDSYVPIAHGRRLFELAQPPKSFQEVAGGHTDAYQVDPLFFKAVAAFITGLGLPLLES